MARIMAIDYGTKRVGIAVTDPLQIIANGLTTVHSTEVITFIKKYIETEALECIVVGQPKHLNNQPSDADRFIEPFVMHLKRSLPGIKIDRVDERYTSKMAFQTMIDGGLKKSARKNKDLVDEISATLILQTYMQLKEIDN
jgi:putative holliday junction resolvase